VAGGVRRVALVTGAARGIGAATVVTLVERGWCVLAVDRAADDPVLPYPLGTEAELEAVAAGCVAPDRVTTFVADVRDVDALAAAVAEAEGRWGGLDAALAVAGVIAGGAPHWDADPSRGQASSR
jgi:NAD(P)-dependent dehydrogenase (short-subunit alcohol dehydrogenase family)